MKKFVCVIICMLGLIGMLSATAMAGETGHYVNGVEGLKAATLPPPGIYWRVYNLFYSTDKMTDEDGDKLPIDFDLFVYALVNRVIWISNYEILGANYGADIIIPLVYTDVEIGAMGLKDDQFGLGDITIEPIVLAWHKERYDASFAFGIYAPTGKYDVNEPASPGKDFWTGMFTGGGTYYFDVDKTWTASILARYEIHSEKGDTAVTPGNDFHFEWGVGKTLAKTWDVGLTGYCQWQVTDDDGSDVTWDESVHDQVYAIGPEVSVFLPPAKLFVSLRSQWEFGAEDRTEGNVTVLTLTKMF